MALASGSSGGVKVKTLLTVDWDYFVPEDPLYDLGHSESLAFLDMMWRSRFGLMDKITTNGAEKGFWKALGTFGKGTALTYVSDSHMYAYGLLSGIDHVLIVDAHHDCWHEDSLGVEKDEGRVYCHNWLRVWLSKSRKRSATWLVPAWSDGRFSLPEDMKGRVEVIRSIEKWGDKPIDRVHVCRSGCWTPPWLDRKFIEFVEDRGGMPIRQQEGPWDPLKERWTEEDLAEVRTRETTLQAALKGMKVGIMSSFLFQEAKVELSSPA